MCNVTVPNNGDEHHIVLPSKMILMSCVSPLPPPLQSV